MSLLMDALKKAELAKRQGADDAAVGLHDEMQASGGLTLEPLQDTGPAEQQGLAAGDGTPTQSSLSLASHLEELDARFLEEAAVAARQGPVPSPAPLTATEAPRPPPLSDSAAPPAAEIQTRTAAPVQRAAQEPVAQEKAAARNLFAAKQPEKPVSRKGFAIAVGVITVLSVSGIGGYFWWQLQPKNMLIASRGPLAPPAPLAPPPAAAPPGPAAAAAPGGTAPAVMPAPSARKDESDSVGPAREKAQQRRAAAREAAEDSDSPIRITREPLKVNPALSSGFEAFSRGEFALAQLEYERARKADPRNTDALHGLAAIAVRQGRHDQAELLFRQITETDPQDTIAIAALLNRGQIDPSMTESRLKSLSAAQPELAAPHFSLGNLYARHGRWNDAQQAYFRAYSAEPENPDILYNLAISLEHLRQNRLAAQYYTQAIAAAQTRPAGFDKAQVAARLHALQP